MFTSDWLTTTCILHGLAAIAYLGVGARVMSRGQPGLTDVLLCVACLVTASWAALIAATWPDMPSIATQALDLMRSLAWYAFVLHLYRRSMVTADQLSRTFATMGLVGMLMIGLLVLISPGGSAEATLFAASTALRLGISVCAILLIENLWRNSGSDARWHVNLPCLALGGMFVYDLALSADSVLTHDVSPTLFAGRALASIIVVPLLIISAARNRAWRVGLRVSRAAAFHTATLIASGVFLLSVAVAGEAFRQLGANWGGVVEVGLVFAAILTIGVFVTSATARSRLRMLVIDHFFSHRYDYRREWNRCIETLSAPDTYVPLHVRAIRAAAEIVDSPGGALLLRDGIDTAFNWAGSWNMPALTAPVMPDHPLIARFGDGDSIVDLTAPGGGGAVPPIPEAWLAVPLRHADRLTGFVLLEPPRAGFTPDREVFDLLRTVARMVAGFIAEQRMTEQLTQTRQLHEYGKRFAFVAHDIKNVSSQLSLLLANAEIHMQNPEFQRDMLATVHGSVQKIGALLRRLREPEQEIGQAVITPLDRVAILVAARERRKDSRITIESDGMRADVAMPQAAFDAVITHLLDNAIEASAPGSVVRIRIRHEARRATLDIVDRGVGMTPEFVRDQLFRPFRTSKSEGTGIGAFQSRELLRQAGGDLVVISEAGGGTTMRVLLPLVGRPETASVRRSA